MSDAENLDELFAELKKDYVASLPEKLQKLTSHFTKRQQDLLREEFHKYKGSGKTYGVPEVTLICQLGELETIKNDLSWDRVKVLIALFKDVKESYEKNSLFDLENDPRFVELKSQI